MTVVIETEDFAVFEIAAFASLRQDLEIPGFRRGHVPDDVARQHISSERIFSEAVERAVAERGSGAIDALFEEVVGEPRIDILKAAPGNPLEFRITVEVLPMVPLDDWQNIRIALVPKPVTADDIDRAVEDLRRSRAKYRAVLRPAQKGDVAEIDFATRVEGVAIEDGSAKQHVFVLGEGRFIPGFEEVVVGMNAGETKTVRLPFPSAWPQKHLSGKEGEFTITLRNLQERLLSDVTDEFTKSLGRFENLEALRANLRDSLIEEYHEAERRRVRTEAVDLIGEKIDAHAIPEVLIGQEIARMREELVSLIEGSGVVWSDYLDKLGKREENLASDFRDGALRRVKAALVLRAIARSAKIEVNQEEVETRVQTILRQAPPLNDTRMNIDPERLRSYTENTIRNEKILEFIEDVVTDSTNQRTNLATNIHE